MKAYWVRTVDPVDEPITVAEAKSHARITDDDSDDVIAAYLRTARAAAEDYLRRGLLTQTWKLYLDDWAEMIWLPMAAPLQSVTTVKYYDTNGTQQTLSSTVYSVDTNSRPGRIVRAVNQTWPSIQADRLAQAIEITYVVGWTAAYLVPDRIKHGVKMYVSYLDADREGLSEIGELARKAAEANWTDTVEWIPPECW